MKNLFNVRTAVIALGLGAVMGTAHAVTKNDVTGGNVYYGLELADNKADYVPSQWKFNGDSGANAGRQAVIEEDGSISVLDASGKYLYGGLVEEMGDVIEEFKLNDDLEAFESTFSTSEEILPDYQPSDWSFKKNDRQAIIEEDGSISILDADGNYLYGGTVDEMLDEIEEFELYDDLEEYDDSWGLPVG